MRRLLRLLTRAYRGLLASVLRTFHGSSPAIPAEFQEDLRRARETEQRYQSTGQPGALDAAISAWERILTHAIFSQTPGAF
jgi:hypothetical protein